MIRKLASQLWQRQSWPAFTKKTNPTKGFTLLELLVSLAIGSVIVYTMLFLVVELLKTNQREASRSDTQREVQSALDYIARDLREAVYVYDGNCLQPSQVAGCPSTTGHAGLLNYLPPELNQSGANFNIPVLAFWRVDPLPKNIVDTCVSQAANFTPIPPATLPLELTGLPCVSRRMYTLVVYSLRSNPANDPTWKGNARITRYQLPQYASTVTPSTGITTAFTQGWVSPITKGTNFPSWPLVPNETTGAISTPTGWARPAFTQEVLIDFVDNLQTTGADVSCPPIPAAVTNQVYVLTPVNTIADKRRGFYTCVNMSRSGALPAVNQPNQEVVVYINGNAAGRPGIPKNTGLRVILPMETRVLTRGALNKSS
jgi:prepilin-type N-terminal cleavage/methylation domain-containing protein